MPDSIVNKTRISIDYDKIVDGINIRNILNQQSTFYGDCTYQGDLIPDDVYYLANGEKPSEMAIILPPENYYEISSTGGALSYTILNDDMFFAAKADSAEKSIVSAEDGVKLINAAGAFELTVSSDGSMPYDMFDISGTANGDVDCQYVSNGVLVNLDNTSDTTITLYHDIETEDYTVPGKYDSFIIGENNNETAIFVDTDNDDKYDTNILQGENTETNPAPDDGGNPTYPSYTTTDTTTTTNANNLRTFRQLPRE